MCLVQSALCQTKRNLVNDKSLDFVTLSDEMILVIGININIVSSGLVQGTNNMDSHSGCHTVRDIFHVS